MAQRADALEAVLARHVGRHDAVRNLLDGLLDHEDLDAKEDTDARGDDEVDVSDSYQVVVECSDESQQQEVYERLTRDGLKCRLLTL